VALVRTDVLKEHITSIFGVKRIGELGTTLAVTSNCFICSVLLTRATWNNIPEAGILQVYFTSLISQTSSGVHPAFFPGGSGYDGAGT
jgi:hypothetical protein